MALYRKSLMLKLLSIIMVLASGKLYSSSVRHFEGKKAESYESAVALLKKHNAELNKLMNKDTLTISDLGQIHQITYTLENAIQKIQHEIALTAEELEKLHIASERGAIKDAGQLGKSYLNKSSKITNGK